MLHLFKLFWFVVKELLFDSKEEYDFRSSKFNSKRMTAAVMLMLSFLLNVWLLHRFYTSSTGYMEIKKENAVMASKQLESTLEVERLSNQLSDAEEKLRVLRLKHRALDKKQSGSVIQ